MPHEFDEQYWESHWREAPERSTGRSIEVNPHLVSTVAGSTAGSALDAGSGEGTEALWLARFGWEVTAVDISAEAQRRAAAREAAAPEASRIDWVVADLATWEPAWRFDLVASHYAHPAGPQLDFYRRISEWVAPGGTLLIVGHHHPAASASDHGHLTHAPPEDVQVTAAGVAALLDPERWVVERADEESRTLADAAGRVVALHDVVVRAVRRTGGGS